MTKPIIGISANQKPISPDSPIIHLSSSIQFAQGVRNAGGLPIYLPVGSDDDARAYIDSIDGLILTGGQDVSPTLYGQEPTTEKQDYNLERDQFEIALIKYALEKQLPILAVCRGMQLLNVYLGGSLHQDIDGHSQGLPLGTYHRVTVEEGSHLSELLPNGTAVNSVHHQSLNRLGDGLTIVARDPRDGTVEAVEKIGYPLIAVQWHPEFLIDTPSQQALFDDLLRYIQAIEK